jgi:hypothetical protein
LLNLNSVIPSSGILDSEVTLPPLSFADNNGLSET